MKISKKTKNARRTFFAEIRTQLADAFPGLDVHVVDGMILPPPIFTPPPKQKQGVKGKH